MYVYMYVGVFLEPTFSFYINAFRCEVNRLIPSFSKCYIEKKRTLQYLVQ